MNGLTVCADGTMKEAQPYSSQAPVKASVYLFTPTLAHIESSGAQCAVTPHALDGQITGELKECGLDTTLEDSGVGSLVHWMPSSLFLQLCFLHRDSEQHSESIMTVKLIC